MSTDGQIHYYSPLRLTSGTKKKELGGGGGGGGGGIETKTVSQTVKRGKRQNSNHLHNVKQVIQSTFQNR